MPANVWSKIGKENRQATLLVFFSSVTVVNNIISNPVTDRRRDAFKGTRETVALHAFCMRAAIFPFSARGKISEVPNKTADETTRCYLCGRTQHHES